jgi:Flp pilus assembly protein TadD
MIWETAITNNNLGALIDLARKAIALRPDVAKNWELLAHHLIKAGKDEEACAVLIEAISKAPIHLKLHLMLANIYYQMRHVDLALEVLRRAPDPPVRDSELTLWRLELLMRARAGGDALQVATDVLVRNPTNSQALLVVGKLARKEGRPEIMLPLCQAALALEPGHTRAVYELAVAFAMLGRSKQASQLIDLERFITVTDVPTPAGYADASAFYFALADEIACNPTLKSDPIGKATTAGFQTSSLPHVGDRAIVRLLELIRMRIDEFEEGLTDESRNAFLESRPTRARLTSWAVTYPGDGHQTPHIHHSGWLSGVFYVSAPERTSANTRAGCLVLGSVEDVRPKFDPPWGTRDIYPTPGRLILFPSYIPHATVPTRSADMRICVAFDVVPDRTGRALANATEASF